MDCLQLARLGGHELARADYRERGEPGARCPTKAVVAIDRVPWSVLEVVEYCSRLMKQGSRLSSILAGKNASMTLDLDPAGSRIQP